MLITSTSMPIPFRMSAVVVRASNAKGGRVSGVIGRLFKKNAPDWYEPIYQQQRKAHSSRRIRVEHGIAHLKNWRSLARHLGRREHMSHTVQAVAGLLSLQQNKNAPPLHQM